MLLCFGWQSFDFTFMLYQCSFTITDHLFWECSKWTTICISSLSFVYPLSCTWNSFTHYLLFLCWCCDHIWLFTFWYVIDKKCICNIHTLFFHCYFLLYNVLNSISINFREKLRTFTSLQSMIDYFLSHQDPYHGPGQAMGLSFSVPQGVKIPSSLLNIYKELQKDLGCTIPSNGNLDKWAIQVIIASSVELYPRLVVCWHSLGMHPYIFVI